jgi:hypothetical protein
MGVPAHRLRTLVFLVGILIFYPNIFATLEPMQNCKTLRQPLLGELAMSRKKRERRKKEREKMLFLVATYVYAASHGQRTHSAQTKINLNWL